MLTLLLWISIAILIINIVVSLVLGHIDNYYNPSIKATHSGIIASLLGICLAALILALPLYNYRRRFILKAALGALILSILAIVFEFALGFYLGGWACLVWLLISIALLLAIRSGEVGAKKINETDPALNSIPLNSQNANHNSNQEVNKIGSEPTLLPEQNSKRCTKQCCGFCCHACCSVATLILMALFTSIAIVYFSKWARFPVYGQLIEFNDSDNNNRYSIQAYCIGQEHPTRPTLILEHGGGSNSMAFYELGMEISQQNWKLCSYDRLGYGRSSVIPRYLSIEKKAEITNFVINKLLQNQGNKNIIIGGWSAGVELSQIYAKLYPANVRGMVFMDGYPDYLTLMAVQDNKTSPVPANTLGVLEIARFFQPFGIGLVVGSNPMPSETGSQYYSAYYQTGYFWESQYFDVANPHQTTPWLTTTAGNAVKPYPSALLDLNWPDITVPLLVLPANETVSNGQYSKMYMKQCEKYLQKCTSANKQIIVMEGDHGYVLKSAKTVSASLHNFFSPLF